MFLLAAILLLWSCGMSDEECVLTDAITQHISEDEGVPYVVFGTEVTSEKENADGTSTLYVRYKLSEHYETGKKFSECTAKVKKSSSGYEVIDYGY